ncbi:MAG TPA: vanadium-dependent haloperoxidase [Chryseosolibacter sp.]|nr:vanadium-dependent haloperoxidase [Chryseosolibacter sp.]
MKNFFALVACSVMFFFSCSVEQDGAWKEKAANPANLHRSVKQVTDVIVHDIFSPPVAARIYAYMSVAAYEAAIHADDRYQSLAGQVNGLDAVPQPNPGEEYSFELAAVQAALTVGRNLVFSEDKMNVFYEQLIKDYKDAGMPEDIFERSIAYGNEVANHIMGWSSKDNYKQSRSFPKYSISKDPATWKPTPPAYMDAIEPHWNKIRTFAIDSAGQFKPAAPTTFSIDKKSKFYKEAIEVYEMGKNLTEEQRAIASFWDCNPFVMNVRGHVMFASKKISPGGHWMNIAHVASSKAKKNFVESAEAYALLSLSLVDGFISCWDEKYRTLVIRPETYINQYIDEEWLPLLQTPPFPEYTSGHSVISSASAVTLTKLFGENFAFTDSTEIEFGMPARSFSSFTHAAEEAAISRMYGGIHYRPAVDEGFVEGKALGHYVVQKIKTRKEQQEQIANAK